MKVRHLYSACFVVTTADVTLLMDPWFSDGAFDGSWYQYPPLPRDAVDVCGPVDVVYISHIHPDHYDAAFLRKYLARFPDTKIIVGETVPPFLLKKMAADGFTATAGRDFTYGKTSVRIAANHAYEFAAIDTAIAVSDGVHSVVNFNDCHYDAAQVSQLVEICPGGRPTFAILPYNGAGPHPQTYEFPDESAMREAAQQKAGLWLGRYAAYVDHLRPLRAMPAAGSYWLGGPLRALNGLRGMNDATDCIGLRPEVTIVLDDGGDAEIDLATLEATRLRTERYDPARVDAYLAELPFPGYDYEREIHLMPGRALPLDPLVRAAVRASSSRVQLDAPLTVVLRTRGADGPAWVFDPMDAAEVRRASGPVEASPRIELDVDARHLYGLLTRLYHWNNAEIGSHISVKRTPDVFRRDLHAWLNGFHV